MLLLILHATSSGGNVSFAFNRRHAEVSFTDKRSQRSKALLDALAAICISEPRKQVIAISLTLTSEGSILCIAENNSVSPEILTHLASVFSQLKEIRSSLQSPLQEVNEEMNTPQPDKESTTASLESQLLGDIFGFSMLKFKQRLLKRKHRFETEVRPGMHAYATAKSSGWTREEVKDYRKFEKLLGMFSICFEWANSPGLGLIVRYIASLVTANALEWRDAIKDEGTTSRLSQWEMEIG
jgi:hypothetical protein